MKSTQSLPSDLLSRLLVAAALFCPTAATVSANHDLCSAALLALWGAFICLMPAFLPRKAYLSFLVILWVLSPLVLALLAYIHLNGVPPQPFIALAILHAADHEEISAAIHMLFASDQYKWWAAAYIGLLSGGTGALFVAMISKNQMSPALRTAVFVFCLLPLVVGVWWQALAISAPSWLVNVSDAQATVVGELGAIVVGAFTYSEDVGLRDGALQKATIYGSQHNEAQESTRISIPTLSILVIGESMRADGFALTKIDRGPWSSALGARVRSNLAAFLPPACASHDSTGYSVPMLITGTTPDHRWGSSR